MSAERSGDATDRVTKFAYDPANGSLLTVKDPLLNTTTIGYNAFGQPTSVQGPIPSEPPTTFAYDANGNLITTTDPLGNATQRVYDAVSRLTSLTDPRQLQTQFTYDALNRATAIVDARHGVTRFGYDGNGNLLTVLDAKGQPTSYSYDPMDRLFTRKDALTRQETYTYDPAGNLIQFTDRKTQPATFSYDALNRRTRADYADGSFTTFTYDAVGRLTRVTDSTSGAIDFFYDNLDRLILEVTPQGAVAYEYDAIGRRTEMTVAGQAPVTYQYDAASRLIQVAQGSLTVGLGYDAAGRRTSLTYPNGTSTIYTYDNASRLTRILHQGPGSTTIEDLVYTYDAAGNRTGLTRANGTASLLPNAVASGTYDAANEQTQFAGATLQYDANGNLANDGVNAYQWDARNRLVGITGGSTATFAYDSLGRRASKTINGVSTQFAYEGNDIVAEISGGAVGASYLRSLNIDEPFIRQTGTGNVHYHTDALGSPLALSNTVGGSAVTYNYEPFGKTTSTGASSNSFQYTGRENDGTGLFYYRARYYSAISHRFLTQDPVPGVVFIPDTMNPYLYVLNDPIGYRDPSGELAPAAAGLLAGALFGGVGSVTGLLAQNITPFSDPATFFALTTLGIANGLVTGALLGAGLPPVIAAPVIGAVNSGLSNFISQAISGRKPVNLCSVAGATVGGAAGGIIRAGVQAGLSGATTVQGTQLAAPVTNAIGSAFTLGTALLPQAFSQIGRGLCGS